MDIYPHTVLAFKRIFFHFISRLSGKTQRIKVGQDQHPKLPQLDFDHV